MDTFPAPWTGIPAALTRFVLILLVLFLAPACALPGSAPGELLQIDAMTDPEYSAFERRASAMIQVGAWALTDEGVLDPDDLNQVAAVVEGIAIGSLSGASTAVLVDAFELDGWRVAALVVFLNEVDLYLEARGAWGGARTAALLDAIAEAIRKGARPPGNEVEEPAPMSPT